MDLKLHFKNSGKSFTLIELLVVIAIIGLLASIVLVSTGEIKNKAKITKALEFAQSIQRGLGAYAVGIWSFDDQANPTKDGSGYNNNGTINGATFSSDTPHAAIGTGTGKYALSFDGVDDYVTLADIDATVWTMEAWIKPDTYGGGGFARILGKGQAVAWDWYLAAAGNEMRVISGGTAVYSVDNSITLGAWQHVLVTYNGTAVRFYVNGVDKTEGTGNISIGQNNTAILIGKSPETATREFDGLIDEARIYEKALTLSEIKKHYAKGLREHQLAKQ